MQEMDDQTELAVRLLLPRSGFAFVAVRLGLSLIRRGRSFIMALQADRSLVLAAIPFRFLKAVVRPCASMLVDKVKVTCWPGAGKVLLRASVRLKLRTYDFFYLHEEPSFINLVNTKSIFLLN